MNIFDTFAKFAKLESIGGILLFTAGVIALILSNTPADGVYEAILNAKASISIADFKLEKPVVIWINEGLMGIYFLLVGLEIKTEVFKGVLSDASKIALPAFGAVGGLVLPAIIYAYLNWGDSYNMRGWAIPTATDIAFTLGIVSLLGKRVPSSLKIFLTAVAIFDDIAAILIIAVFYTAELSLSSFMMAGVAVLVLVLMNRMGVKNLIAYCVVGAFLWVSVLKSGVHATLSGIVLAFAIPLTDKKDPNHSPVETLENILHPWITFIVLPLFAFANSGVTFAGLTWSHFTNRATLGIIFGLFIGKQVGIFTTCWLLIKSGVAKLPAGATWSSLYGIAIICGVGFTMSLFIGSLAFPEQGIDYIHTDRLGIMIGSVVSGIVGYFWLKMSCKSNPEDEN